MSRTTKLYPTPQNCQHSNEDTLSLGTVISYLKTLFEQAENDPQGLPNTAKLSGWNGIVLSYEREPTAEELLAERVEAANARVLRVRDKLLGARTTGLTPDDLRELIRELGDV